ncbi:potassium-transporting ATPase subunit KdpA [Paenibacillus assamensis]|uniref:potassium-transporting ATPase subunit KdpA n=1 Tax=Paenibacillus assamensis TaxID=311244 RepID=UPI000410701B|nr:potassium-transporting ATPase subunit KdpA [Paenibacillus assamensis]
MTLLGWVSIGLTLLLVLVLARPTGIYLARVFHSEGARMPLNGIFGPIEKLLFKLFGIKETNQTWKSYATALILTNVFMMLLVYTVLRLQGSLPLNPSGIAGMEPTLAFNTTISFMTNTNLQHYSGESGLSYLSQTLGITFMMFTAPATSLAIAFAFMRGIAGKPLGNFFVDLVRSIVRVLMPIAIIAAILFIALGTPQTFAPTETVTTLQGAEQQIARGPIASFLSIKELGNNGGGFMGVNSAHPFENTNGINNMLQIVLMLLLTTSLPFAYGRIVGSAKEGRVLFVAMSIMFMMMLGIAVTAEQSGNPALHQLGMSGPSMEGKEVRFGVAQSALYAVVTTASETGAVNTMHDTLTPLGGLVPLGNMMLNTVFGGVGVGFVNVLMYAMIAVFLSGLMVGRTPEFLGRKLEIREMKLIAVTLIIQPILILVPTAIALVFYPETISNAGFHGISQVLYEYTSSAANNGSGFEGLGDATPYWNISTGLVMFFGRYISMITLLAVAGSLMAKRPVPVTSGTFKTSNATFGTIFVGTILIVGALTFFPILVLGPIAEHLTLWK